MTVRLLSVCATVAFSVSAIAADDITVEDVVDFATIGNPQFPDWRGFHAMDKDVAAFSPDRKLIAVIVSTGNSRAQTNDASIFIYKAQSILSPVAETERVAQFSATENYVPISRLRWLSDAKTIVFAGADGAEVPQIYKLDTRSHELTKLTRLRDPLLWYEISSDGQRLTVVTRPQSQPPEDDVACLRYGCRVSADSLFFAERGAAEWSGVVSVYNLPVSRVGTVPSIESNHAQIDRCEDYFEGGISPQGRFALRTCSLKTSSLPAWWIGYTADPNLRAALSGADNLYAQQIFLVDLDRAQAQLLIDAPWTSKAAPPIWADGGKQLILLGALEPPSRANKTLTGKQASTFAILAVDVATRKVIRIADLAGASWKISNSVWEQDSEALTVDIDEPGASSRCMKYKRERGGWAGGPCSDRGKSKKGRNEDRVILKIQQSLNERPVLVAEDVDSRTTVRLLDPNPWLAQRKLGKVEAVTWKLRNGMTWRGGLYYPPDFVQGKRYPLMIQTHGFRNGIFSMDGYARNFAGRALVAHDIVLLQVAEKFDDAGRKRSGTSEEWTIAQTGYEAAIDYLDGLGLIDRGRVGIQGWSRTGGHVGYTLTHSTYSFAVGAFTSTADFGWWSYLAAGAPPSADLFYGAAPFGDGLSQWVKSSPSFNLDRVEAPMLMWADTGLRTLWDWYAGLRRLGKPVEYWYLPGGAHDVLKPGQRIQTNQLLVDWFRFWLKDEEDPDPRKMDQYARWCAMRAQRKAQIIH